MNERIALLREHAASQRLNDFDFGTPVRRAGGWAETTSDAMTCRVELGAAYESRALTFRVVFLPDSSRVRGVEVGERLPVI